MKNGIVNDTGIVALHDSGRIIAAPFDADQVQPASLDLRVGAKAWRVRASFLPGGVTVADKLKRFALHEFPLDAGAVLETGCVYIVPLLESLALADDMSASANPKSSTGRLDIFTRVITDRAERFDQVPAGYSGPLYLEISPRTFPIVVRQGSRLSQIRFRTTGPLGSSLLNDDELAALHERETLVASAMPDIGSLFGQGGGIALSIDLSGNADGLVGYRGKRHTGLVDVDKKAACSVLDYWEPILSRRSDMSAIDGRDLILDPDEFYILVSNEAVHVPPDYAAEMVPFDPLVGEFRVHYAGFFDPGFGHDAAGGTGARAVLEVRSHEVPFILEHGQTVGRLLYERMQERPARLYGIDLASNYQAQGLKLSKHFIEQP